MKSTPGYGFYHFNKRADAQEAQSMGKTYQHGAGSKGSMKTVKRVASGKLNTGKAK